MLDNYDHRKKTYVLFGIWTHLKPQMFISLINNEWQPHFDTKVVSTEEIVENGHVGHSHEGEKS